ncbi:transposase, partial [Spiribacter sp. C176]|nr:transposase [Spiribacter salilacus]
RHVVGQWIRFYNNERPHQSLGYAAPSAHPALGS